MILLFIILIYDIKIKKIFKEEKKVDDDNSTQKTMGNEHNIIYFTNTVDTVNHVEKIDETPSLKKTEPTRYIAAVTFSVLIYSLCAWIVHAGFLEIIDLELPLLILLTLILTELIIQGYAKYIYPLYVIAIGLSYSFIGTNYALLIIISLTSVVITRCLEKIYYNPIDYPNIGKDEFKISSIFYRMKYHILLSFMLFVIFMLVGYYYPGVFQPVVMPSVENLHNNVQEGTLALETVPLFVNNFSVALNMILSGFYLSIYTIYVLIFNALFIGFSGAITNIKYFLAFTLPHGIIELTAIILSCAAGFRITHAFLVLLNGIKLNKDNKNEIFVDACNVFIKMFLDVGILIIIIIVLLLVAAFIEANITATVGTFLYNL